MVLCVRRCATKCCSSLSPPCRARLTESPATPASQAGRMRECRLTLRGGKLVSFNCRSVDRACAKAAVHMCAVVAQVVALFVFVAVLWWLWCAIAQSSSWHCSAASYTGAGHYCRGMNYESERQKVSTSLNADWSDKSCFTTV